MGTGAPNKESHLKETVQYVQNGTAKPFSLGEILATIEGKRTEIGVRCANVPFHVYAAACRVSNVLELKPKKGCLENRLQHQEQEI